MTISILKRLNRVQRGAKVLRKYGSNAHLWLPGVGYINGIQAGNYLDSAGTTLASVDNPVGLVLDAANFSVGSNLISNPGPFVTTTGWNVFTSCSLAASGGYLQITNTANNGAAQFAQTTVAGVTYKYTVTNASASASFQVYDVSSGAFLFSVNAGQTVSGYSTATSTAGGVRIFVIGAAGTIGQLAIATLQPISGIPVTQTVTANKPTLRRGVTNSFTYSQDMTQHSANLMLGATATATVLSCTSTYNSGYRPDFSAANGWTPAVGQYTMAISISAGTLSQVFLGVDGGNCTLTGSGPGLTTLTAAPQIFVIPVNITAVGTVFRWQIFNQTGQAGTYNIQAVGLFPGTLTASQIQACGGIPLTTSAAASSSAGNWGWQFKAANTQQMSLPLSTGPSGVLVCAVSPASASWQGFIGSGGQAAGTPGIALAMENTLKPRVLFGSASSPNLALVAQAPITLGSSFVLSAQWGPSSQTLRINGAQSNASASSANPTSGNTFAIGNFTPGGSDYCDGTMFGGAFINAASVPTADILAIERMLAVFAGPTGVTF